MLNRNIFYSQSIDFLNQLYSEFNSSFLTFPKHWHIDHICYRTSTLEQYVILKKAFLDFSDLVIESPVNGRNISTFALKKPLIFNEHYIYNVELPEPKSGSHYQDGFEHIEMVCDKPLDSLTTLYPKLNWKPLPNTKHYNSELRCDFKTGSIKFHNQSLASVIHLEKKPKIFSAIIDSQVLLDLAPFHPLVVGTYPLDIQTEGSDVDIVLSHTNLQEIEECFLKFYSYLPDFKIQSSCILERDTLIAQFTFNSVPFELFAQKLLSFEQNGYRHFQVEERLLKVGGPNFKQKIVDLRKDGLKTEPAFAKALSLSGDPYIALSNLFFKSDDELHRLISN
jgi:uncharacterized protein